MIGDILVGISFKTMGLVGLVGELDAVDLAAKRAAIAQGLFSGELSKTQAQALRTGLAVDAVSSRMTKMRAAYAGMVAFGGGIAIGAAVNEAAKFQLAMTSAQLATQASAQDFQKMQAMALQMSGVTAQSATTIAQEMTVAAQGGLGVLGAGKLMQLFPILAKFADVQQFMAQGRGHTFNPVDSISYGVQFAHMLGAYTPDKMQNMLEYMTKFLTVQSEEPMRALRQAKYFVPLGKALGMNDEDIFEMLSIMGTTGFLQGRGGSGMGRVLMGAINSVTMTSHLQKAQFNALKDLGILDSAGHNLTLTPDGDKLNYTNFNRIMQADYAKMGPVRYAQDLKAAFGLIASQWMNVLETPWVQEQMGRIRRRFHDLGDDPIGVFFDKLMTNFLPQWQRFMTNFVNLGIAVMLPLLPAFTQAFKFMADAMGALGKILTDNPLLGAGVGVALLVGVGAAALEAAGSLLALRGSILGLSASAGTGAAANTLTGFWATGIGRMVMLLGRYLPYLALLVGIYEIAKNHWDHAKKLDPHGAPVHTRRYVKQLYEGPKTPWDYLEAFLFPNMYPAGWATGHKESLQDFMNQRGMGGFGANEFMGVPGYSSLPFIHSRRGAPTPYRDMLAPLKTAVGDPLQKAINGGVGQSLGETMRVQSKYTTENIVQAIQNLGHTLVDFKDAMNFGTITLVTPDGQKIIQRRLQNHQRTLGGRGGGGNTSNPRVRSGQ